MRWKAISSAPLGQKPQARKIGSRAEICVFSRASSSGSSLGSEACVGAAAAVLASLLAMERDARICLVFPEAVY